MRPICYVPGGPYDVMILAAFAAGAGAEMRFLANGVSKVFEPGRPAVIWGLLRGAPELVKLCRKTGTPWLYIDHGYFRRGHYHGYYRCTWNGYQQNTIVPTNAERWARLTLPIEPWRTKPGDLIIVCPPSGVVAMEMGQEAWLPQILTKIKLRTNRRVIIREKSAADVLPLKEAVRNCFALVTYNSIAAVEAVMYGVPVYVDPCSAAAPMGDTDITHIGSMPPMPDRQPWLWSLADSQFTLDEMRAGIAWRILRERMPGQAVASAAAE